MEKHEREIALSLLGELQHSMVAAKALDRARGVSLWADRVGTLVTILEEELHVVPQPHTDGLRELDRLIQKRREREQD